MEVFDIRRESRHLLVVRCRNNDGPPDALPEHRQKERAGTPRQARNNNVAFSANRFRGNAPEVCSLADTAINLRYAFF
jgi:hypothetical protein